MFKSQKIIDAKIGESKAQINIAKKKLERKFERNFNKWREYDLLTCLIAIVGLALAIVDWEYTRVSAVRIARDYDCKLPDDPSSYTPKDKADCYDKIVNERYRLSETNFVRVVIMFVSVFGVITLYFRHSVKTRWLNEDLPFEVLNSQYFMNLEGRDEVEAKGFKRRVWF